MTHRSKSVIMANYHQISAQPAHQDRLVLSRGTKVRTPHGDGTVWHHITDPHFKLWRVMLANGKTVVVHEHQLGVR